MLSGFPISLAINRLRAKSLEGSKTKKEKDCSKSAMRILNTSHLINFFERERKSEGERERKREGERKIERK